MLFRDNSGKLIEIKKDEYVNDQEYYIRICKLYNIKFPKSKSELERLQSLINGHR